MLNNEKTTQQVKFNQNKQTNTQNQQERLSRSVIRGIRRSQSVSVSRENANENANLRSKQEKPPSKNSQQSINTFRARGSRDAEDNYRDVLAQIAEIMNIYSDRARFILVGDMNASLTRDIPTSRDLVFRKFCESQSLSMGDNYPIQDTFQHASGNSSSQIDYILCSVGENLNLIKGISILTWDPSNTSTHVSVTCCLPDISKQLQTDDSNPFRKKIRWEKLDRDQYRKSVESGVQGISLETVSLSNLNAKLQVFCDVLVDAAEKSAPCIRRGKKKPLCSDELKAASIMGKQVFFQWKKAGRPGPQHPLFIHCRVAKKHLRSTQRRQQAAYRSTVYQDIMAADSSNKGK